MIVGILLTTAVSVLSVVNPYISGQIVDQVISGGKYDRLMPFIGCLIGVTIVMGVLRFLFQVAFETASQGVLYDMRDKVYRKLLEEDFAFYNKKRTGDLMSRQTGDMDAIRHFVAYVVYMVYQSVLMFVFALLMIFTVNTKLAFAMLVVLPFTAFATYRQTKEVRPAFKRNRDCFSSLNAFVQENVSGNRVVKAFAKEDFEIEKFNKENDKFRAAQIDASKIWMKYVPIFEVLSYALTIILILYGGYMVIQGEITLGQLVTAAGIIKIAVGVNGLPFRLVAQITAVHCFAAGRSHETKKIAQAVRYSCRLCTSGAKQLGSAVLTTRSCPSSVRSS